MATAPDLEQALRNCSREPIHIPGAIQPHGALLVAAGEPPVITHASQNTGEFLGRAPEEMLGQPLADVLEAGNCAWDLADLPEEGLLPVPFVTTFGGNALVLVAHRREGRAILEWEPDGVAGELLRLQRGLQMTLAQMRESGSLPDFFAICSRYISELTGYERVMVYQFAPDWHGEVVGEHLTAEVDSYLGHHFPASDIPDQARALYAKNWIRCIPTVDYMPVALLGAEGQAPVDLGFSTLRSVSPVHLQYLRNMNVGASMSISLMVNGRLWGLIACHHRTARPLSPAVRAACELFGQAASLEIGSKQEQLHLQEFAQASAIQTRLFDVIAREAKFLDALIKYTPQLLEFMHAEGAAICVNGVVTLLGDTPGGDAVAKITAWLMESDPGSVFATDCLSALIPAMEEHKEVASGLLAVRLSRVDPNFILWFRPEAVTTVTWAGDPRKGLATGAPDQPLSPRTSFAAWVEIVNAHSLPWTEAERQGAREVRNAVNALVLRRTDQLLRVNAELERQNADLNSFAYVASHDLREPLRGISHYANFLREDHWELLPPEARQRLDRISSLAERSEQLMTSLAHYSRVGRMEVERKPTPLDRALDETLESLEIVLVKAEVEIRRPRELPTIDCDPVLVREVFANLIMNGVRYNEAEKKWIEIGWREPDASTGDPRPIIYVQDNGIGIESRHFESVFKIFRRLHLPEKFGGGTGAGLAIVKSIVSRHEGSIWIDSQVGKGTTFNFKL